MSKISTRWSTHDKPPLTLKEQLRNILLSFHRSKNYVYDTTIEDIVVREVATHAVEYALFEVYTHLKVNKAGSSFNYATALAHLLRQKGYICGIVTSREKNTINVSVAYVQNGELLVCDIGKYIQGLAKIEKCLAIPYYEFLKKVGCKAYLYSLDRINGSYVDAICSCTSNITPEEFISLSYYSNL